MSLDIETFLKNAFRRSYRIRISQPGVNTLEVTFPFEVVEKEARKLGISVEDFVRQFQVVAHFDGNDARVIYIFEKIVS